MIEEQGAGLVFEVEGGQVFGCAIEEQVGGKGPEFFLFLGGGLGEKVLTAVAAGNPEPLVIGGVQDTGP